MKEFVMIWRCIGQRLQKVLVREIMGTKVRCYNYHKGTKTYESQPKDKIEISTKREVPRGTFEEKGSERHVSCVLRLKQHPFCLIYELQCE